MTLSSNRSLATPPPLQHFTLDNGLRVYLRSDRRSQLASVRFNLHVGAAHESEGRSGVSHALSHMVYNASRKLPSGQYDAFMSALGAQPNAHTEHDQTYYPLTLPCQYLNVALEALADITFHPLLTRTEFEKTMVSVKQERQRDLDAAAPSVTAQIAHRAFCYGNSPYGREVIGKCEDLDSLTLDHVRDWHERWYQPNNAALVVVGPIELAELQVLAERHFGSLPSALHTDAPVGESTKLRGQRWQSHSAAGLKDHLRMGFRIPSQATAQSPEQACALRLLPSLLFENRKERVRERLCGPDAILDSLNTDHVAFQRSDTLLDLQVNYMSSKVTPEQAVAAIMEQIRTLEHTPFNQEAITIAKTRWRARQVFAADDIARRGQAICDYLACGLDPSLLEMEEQTVKNLSSDCLQESACTFLTEDRLSITLMSGDTDHV